MSGKATNQELAFRAKVDLSTTMAAM
jgi:hypothetical protein